MPIPEVKLSRGIHVMHLFFRVDRVRWADLPVEARRQSADALEKLCAANAGPSHPRLLTYANVGGKADFAFMLHADTLGNIGALQRSVETCFPPGVLVPVYQFLSVTELPEYVSTEDDMRNGLVRDEKLELGSEAFEARLTALKARHAEYEHYRLYPELPDWEVMGFYPMSKRRLAADNWYSLDFPTRKKLMAGHARVGRKFSGRISQLITGATGLDDWEWGVTLMAHQTDALKDIVYEMRFDEVTARFGEFGQFYINLRLSPLDLFAHLRLTE